MLESLARHGLLLKQDRVLPSVVGLMTGESLKTSWWVHPKARAIFRVLGQLADHPDVLFTKLVSDKDTLVHRRLWPALLRVAVSGEPWQTRGLSGEARRLFGRLRRRGAPVRASGPAVAELDRRLLARAEEVHTESGRHERVLETWTAWARRAGCVPAGSPDLARETLEKAARDLGAADSALPWRRGPHGANSVSSRSRRGRGGKQRRRP